MAFYRQISGIGSYSSVLHVLERGVLAYLLFHVLVIRPAYLYVLGHEFVHVLATWLCGGKIVSFNVTPSGGSVVTSKTNFFIELSPYFVPIYTILLGPTFLLLRASGKGSPILSVVFVFLVGVTLAFHFVMTSEVIRLRQPDIVRSGLVFSLILIFICNLIITMAVFCPLFDDLSFVSFIKSSGSNSVEIYRVAYSKILTLVSARLT
ncbi:hypothetical protein ACFL5Y_02040 [Candidatus Omnitrophota bacterium]